MKGQVYPFELPTLKKLNTICEEQNQELIVKRTNHEAGGDKNLIARMEIKDHKQTFLNRPPDNKIDLYIEKNLKV